MQDLLIIRHGESEWNLEKRWQGWRDSALTAWGRQQARDRADALLRSGFAPAVVHTSDLGRAAQTAEVIAEALGAPLQHHHGLRERSGGDWEGFTAEEIDERWPGKRMAWRNGEILTVPGGEADDTVLTRVDEALASVVASGLPALVVTHGGVMRLIATRAGADVHRLTPNLGGYWFTLDNGRIVSPQSLDDLATAEEPAVE